MPLGWIDFSKAERNKVLTVLDMLSEDGTLDELGIAPVRDGFSNIFFPGTSTIQTRAKYFMIVPYALRDLERGNITSMNQFLEAFDRIERSCGERFRANKPDDTGIIGSRSLASGKWVKRTPADIYWAGLRSYDIFRGGKLSLSEYARAVCSEKGQKSNLVKLGNRNDNAEENEADDKRAGDVKSYHYWNIPTYKADWMDSLVMEMSEEEASFLKKQIILTSKNSIFAYSLEHGIKEILDISDFHELGTIIGKYPDEMQADYWLAEQFSEFNFVLRILYNIVLSDGKNEDANELFDEYRDHLQEISELDLEAVFERTGTKHNTQMCSFLHNAKKAMQEQDIDRLKMLISQREKSLKTVSRARTAHPGNFDETAWYGGGRLGYRFGNAKQLMNDIFTGEEGKHA
jgi:hypothetical protein